MLKIGLCLSLLVITGCASTSPQSLDTNVSRHHEFKSELAVSGKQVLLGGIVLTEPLHTLNGKYFLKVSSVELDHEYRPVSKRKVVGAPVFEVLIDDISKPERFRVGTEVTVLGDLSKTSAGYQLDSKKIYLWTQTPIYKKTLISQSEEGMTSDTNWLWYCNSCERMQPNLVKKKRVGPFVSADKPNLGISAQKNPYKEL